MRTIRIPEAIFALARVQAGLVSTKQCLQLGIGSNTRARLVASGRWGRPTRGLYAIPAATVGADEWGHAHARAVWTALLLEPEDVMPVGLTALALHGVWGLPQEVGVQVTYGRGRRARSRSGIIARQFAKPLETVLVGDRQVPTVTTALIQALPEVGRTLAVVLLDSALNRGLASVQELERVRRGVRGRRGAARLHAVWPLVDGRSESPIETRARLECIDAGLEPTSLQVELDDGQGEFVARGDLGWQRDDGSWVIVEMDGHLVHETPRALFADRTRQNAVATKTDAAMLRFTSKDLGTGRIPHTVRQMLTATPRRTGGYGS